MANDKQPLLTAAQLAQQLNIPSRFSVYQLARKGRIPFLKIGPRCLRFDRAKVEAALEK